jgi:hypothetical protein
MRSLRWSVVAIAILASGGGAGAQVYSGNDTGGIIPWSCENEAAARDVAGEYCARWDKVARITSVHRQYGDFIGFNCLWRPGIARFQLPAVGTRSVCRERVIIRHAHRHRRHSAPATE